MSKPPIFAYFGFDRLLRKIPLKTSDIYGRIMIGMLGEPIEELDIIDF